MLPSIFRGRKNLVRLGIVFLGVLTASGAALAALTLTTDTCVTSRNFSLTRYAYNFPHNGSDTNGVGPFGIDFRPPNSTSDSRVFVTRFSGTDMYLYNLPNSAIGDPAIDMTGSFPVTHPTAGTMPVAEMTLFDGSSTKVHYFFGRGGTWDDINEFGPSGAFPLEGPGSVRITGISEPLGMAPFPPAATMNTQYVNHLFVCASGTSEIYDISYADYLNPTKTLWKTGVPCDALAFDAKGEYLYAALNSLNVIRRYKVSDKSSDWDSAAVSVGVDGIALGTGALDGHIYGNYNSGDIWEFPLPGTAGTSCHIATGGTRGDFIATDPWRLCNNSMYPPPSSMLVTQTSEIYRLDPPNGGFFGPPTSSMVPLTDSSTPVPALSGWSMATLIILLSLATAVLLYRRQRAAGSPA